jgi:hypothetical protein
MLCLGPPLVIPAGETVHGSLEVAERSERASWIVTTAT